MLVLTRRAAERVFIGSDITVTVVEIDMSRGRIRLGIDAPQGTAIFREEVLKRRTPPDPVEAAADRLKAAHEAWQAAEAGYKAALAAREKGVTT